MQAHPLASRCPLRGGGKKGGVPPVPSDRAACAHRETPDRAARPRRARDLTAGLRCQVELRNLTYACTSPDRAGVLAVHAI